jgi:hypothetical protein
MFNSPVQGNADSSIKPCRTLDSQGKCANPVPSRSFPVAFSRFRGNLGKIKIPTKTLANRDFRRCGFSLGGKERFEENSRSHRWIIV